LGVNVDADDNALKKAYRKQAMKVCFFFHMSFPQTTAEVCLCTGIGDNNELN
jgi:hypothetical protein